MAHRYDYLGDPDGHVYWTEYTGNYLYTPNIGGPTGSLDSTGQRPIHVYSVGTDWSKGATYHQIAVGGTVTGGGTTFGNSPFTFEHRVGHGGGRLEVGHSHTNGYHLIDSADGDDHDDGGIPGWFIWATAPDAPTMLDATPQPAGVIRVRFRGNGDGGAGITGWKLQVARDEGFTDIVTTLDSSGTTDFQGIPGTMYHFRAAGRNEVVDSIGRYGAWSGTSSARARSGGKISVDGEWRYGVINVDPGDGQWHPGIIRVSVGGVWKYAL